MTLRQVLIGLWMVTIPAGYAQQTPMPGMAGMNMGGTNMDSSGGMMNDLFVMTGSDFDRLGLVPRANYSLGIGHMFKFLKKNPLGDEVTFSYMYENSGGHGFWHTEFGEHTESAGLMKNFRLPGTKRVTGYGWAQTGLTTFTGNARLQNRLDSSISLGAIMHIKRHSSVWIQESYGKVVTVPWFTTASIGYGWSW